MCGIAGQIGGDPLGVADMVFAMGHRGPDFSECRSFGDGVVLGHARLAIIDTSPAGRQPMTFGKWAITFNGEIYNFKELRAHLETKGERFQTQTDTEVLLRMWALFGPDCLQSLDGQFAFAIYDTETKELTLVRDRAGEKPLYWMQRRGVAAFASELRPLLTGPVEVDHDALALYALYRYVPAPRSIVEGINKLPPGHFMVVKADGTTTLKRWWSWEVEPDVHASGNGFKEVCDDVDAALAESVRRRLVSDVPLGLFLSGGIDSSLTAALARKLGHRPKTFSIGFENDNGSEHHQARLIANHLGTDHHEHIFGSSDLESVGRTIGNRMDEPNGDRSCVPTYLLSQFAKQHVTVALSGDGGDELFGGYGRYFGDPFVADQYMGSIYYSHLLPVYGIKSSAEIHPIVDSEIEAMRPLTETFGKQYIHALRQLDFNRYLPGCVLSKMDRLSMQHSLEVRTPYLEPQLMDLARKLPTQYVMNSQYGKLVLREIAGRYLPREIALAPKKGFGLPKSVFAQNGKLLQEMFEEARPHGERVGFPLPPNNMNAIWCYIVLGQWLRSINA